MILLGKEYWNLWGWYGKGWNIVINIVFVIIGYNI